MGYGLVRGITTIAAIHRTTQMGFSAQLDHLQWVTVTCPSALRCTPLEPSPAQTGCRTGLTGFGITTYRRLARVSTWHSFHRALFLTPKSGKDGVISPLSILILAKSIKRGTHVSHIKYKLGKDHFFCLICCFILNMNQFFSIKGIPASEVQCDIDQLYDLTDRQDVERYAWDGSDVDYNVTIW